MKKYGFYLIVAFGLIVSSCVTASFTQTGGQAFPEYYGTVRVIGELPEDVQYSEIGIVSAKGGSIHNKADIIKALQKKAARNGANSIVLIDTEEEYVSMFGANQGGAFGSSTTYREITAVAIKVQQRD